ncbi:hypothetical protein BHE74_00018760 [Ensete ventricosum]|nr:hypothetical protein BHE74_00018760 [Ensete ventricosum]
MKNPWNNMISPLSLQEFMSLTSVQGKLCVSAPCFIFYVDSLHVAWILHQVPPKLLRSSICIELMVTLTPTIPRVNPPLSLISTSTRSVPSYDVVMDCSLTRSRNASTNALPHSRSSDDSSLLTRFFFSLFFFLPPLADTVRNWSPTVEIDCYRPKTASDGRNRPLLIGFRSPHALAARRSPARRRRPCSPRATNVPVWGDETSPYAGRETEATSP